MNQKFEQVPLWNGDTIDTIKKYRVVCFKRLDSEDPFEPYTYTEALKDKEYCELIDPENIYRIEELGD